MNEPKRPVFGDPNSLYFEVRVIDESLRGVGIRTGNAVNFRRSVTFWDGDLIAAQTPRGLEVALAYHIEGDRVRLEGAHPRCPVRTYPRHMVKVLGVAYPANESEPVAEGDGLAWPEYIFDGRAA